DIGDEDGDLHNVAEAGAARLQDATHILEDAAGLSADVVRTDELAVLVERELAGDVDRIADTPAMRVPGPRIGHVDGLNCRACHRVPPDRCGLRGRAKDESPCQVV